MTGETTATSAGYTDNSNSPFSRESSELDDMRKELQDIKRQLAVQEAERNVQKQ